MQEPHSFPLLDANPEGTEAEYTAADEAFYETEYDAPLWDRRRVVLLLIILALASMAFIVFVVTLETRLPSLPLPPLAPPVHV